MRASVWFNVALVCALFAGAGCKRDSNAQTQSFDVGGVVRATDLTDGTLRVEHEKIPNYMAAMTMSLPVKPKELLKTLEPGDAIRFRLEVTTNDSWISRVEKLAVGSPASLAASASGSAPASDRSSNRLQIGEKVPEFTIIDQHGRARSLSDFRGKSVLITFIYTRCPLPNFCPLLSSKVAELQQALSTNVPGKFHLISITIDPEHDTPQVLKSYARSWTKDDRTWTFGVAEHGELEHIASGFGLVYERNGTGTIDHDLRTVLLDPQGRLMHVWKSNFWKPAEVLDRVREL